MTITSQQNQKLKEIRRLNQRRRAREEAQRFVAEGEDLLNAADRAGWTPVERYCAAGSGLPGTEVDPELLAGASELGSGTRTLAVYEEPGWKKPTGPLVLYLHGIRDPGNVGTILRSAEAFGASSVVLGRDTADPYGPKAVRASMGAIFTVPLARAAPGELPGTVLALDAGGETRLSDLKLDGEVSLLVGAERAGLPEELLEQADVVARIPIANHSLNAAMAATVALYELRRMAR
jgi:TrmH family RNA methyltransferase